MIRYLTLAEVLKLHRRIVEESGGALGLRDVGLLESAVNQPRMTFGEQELYPTLIDKASALCFSMVMNHPFIDGNKRTGHAAMETFLVLNGLEISAPADKQEQIILNLASGELRRDAFTEWLQQNVKES
ncbi:type II toxin-antitoxin system death-on-curing family toxin [bacterium]|nr:type II toxin-antitoxin system death-on-curing family toxin [bacterium]